MASHSFRGLTSSFGGAGGYKPFQFTASTASLLASANRSTLAVSKTGSEVAKIRASLFVKSNDVSSLQPKSNKENVDTFGLNVPRVSGGARTNMHNEMQMNIGQKRKFIAEPSHNMVARAPLTDITAHVLERDYKVHISELDKIRKVRPDSNRASVIQGHSEAAQFTFNMPYLSKSTKVLGDRVIKKPISPKKKQLQNQLRKESDKASMKSDPKKTQDTFSFGISKLPLQPLSDNIPNKKKSIASATKKDALFDMRVQLGLLKPNADQMKLKAPTAPFITQMTTFGQKYSSVSKAGRSFDNARFSLGTF